MSNNLDQLESQLKGAVEDYQPDYSSRAWDRLSKDLGHAYPKWYYLAASVVMLAVSFAAYSYLNDKPTEIKNVSLAEKQMVVAPQKEQAMNNNAQHIQESKSETVNQQIIHNTIKPQQVVDEKQQNKKQTEILNQQEQQNIDEVEKQANPILVQAIDSNKTKEDKNVKLVFNPRIVLSTKTGCQPLQEEFTVVNLPSNARLEWKVGEKILSHAKAFHYQFSNSGIYTIMLNVATADTNYTVEEKIEVKKTPSADFKYIEQDGNVKLVNLTKDYETCSWSFLGKTVTEEQAAFKIMYSDKYPVELEVENENGCRSIKKMVIDYKVDHHIFAPNAFSPDGDGVNDVFFVEYKPQEGHSYTLQVFNALGKKVFETKDRTKAWNGKINNINSTSRHEKFLWRLIIKDKRGKKEIEEGYFERLVQ